MRPWGETMAALFARTAISDLTLANPLYAGATVSAYTVDSFRRQDHHACDALCRPDGHHHPVQSPAAEQPWAVGASRFMSTHR